MRSISGCVTGTRVGGESVRPPSGYGSVTRAGGESVRSISGCVTGTRAGGESVSRLQGKSLSQEWMVSESGRPKGVLLSEE